MRQPLKAPKQLLQERELYSSLISLVVLVVRTVYVQTFNEHARRWFSVSSRNIPLGRKTSLVDRDERRCRLGKYLSKLTRPTGAAKYPMSHPRVRVWIR